MPEKRSFFRDGINSDLTQGSVFYRAYAEDYSDFINYGLVITARCDISQEKAPIYSYLPLISFDNWFLGEFTKVLYNKVNKSVYKNLISAFSQIGGSELLLETYGLDVLEKRFSDEGKKAQRENFFKKVQEYKLLQRLLSDEIEVKEVKSIINSSKLFLSESEKIVDDLISQNLAGYYFIDDITNDGAHVLKLRDVYHIKSSYALELKNGTRLPNVDYGEDQNEVSFTVGEIKSPYIEHILQKFTNIFSRIGIDDPDKCMIKELIGN